MNVVYILFYKNETSLSAAPFVVGVYEKEEDALNRKAQMFDSEKYFIEEWEVEQ